MTFRSLTSLAHPKFLMVAGALAVSSLVQAQNDVGQTSRPAIEQTQNEGVPLSALSPNAPDSYTVKRGDTLWAISGLFLKAPWRWPELWGMNKAAIRNPHLIYPGQILYLDRSNGRARLRSGRPVGGSGVARLSPEVRSTPLQADAIQAIPSHVISPFLAEMVVVDAESFAQAPRFVAGEEGRTLLVQGDRAYVRAWRQSDLDAGVNGGNTFRIYRNAEPLKDPETGEILAYEAKYLGRAELARPSGQAMKDGELIKPPVEGSPVLPLYNENRPFDCGSCPETADNTAINPVTGYPYNTVIGEAGAQSDWREDWRSSYQGTFDNRIKDDRQAQIVPATADILLSREEIRIGDRLGPDVSANPFATYIPQPAPENLRAQVISVYTGEVFAGQNQIVSLNKGKADGVPQGAVFSVLSKGELVRDRTDSSRPLLRLPNERNGHLMVFQVFDKVSYALLLGVKSPVKSGDFAIAPSAPENEMQED